MNFTSLLRKASLMLLMVNIDSNPIIGEWKPLEDSAGCGDLITFAKDKTFELIVGNKILIEGTYKKVEKDKYILKFLNGEHAEAKIFYSKRLLLKLSNDEREICQSYKPTYN